MLSHGNCFKISSHHGTRSDWSLDQSRLHLGSARNIVSRACRTDPPPRRAFPIYNISQRELSLLTSSAFSLVITWPCFLYSRKLTITYKIPLSPGHGYALKGRRLPETGRFDLYYTNKRYIPLCAHVSLYFSCLYSIEKSNLYPYIIPAVSVLSICMLPADFPVLGDIATEAFWDDEVFAWLFPHRAQFPKDFKNTWVSMFRFQLHKPGWHCFVSETEEVDSIW